MKVLYKLCQSSYFLTFLKVFVREQNPFRYCHFLQNSPIQDTSKVMLYFTSIGKIPFFYLNILVNVTMLQGFVCNVKNISVNHVGIS